MEKESEKSQFEEMSLTEADEEDLESAMASASDQREEELQVSNFRSLHPTDTDKFVYKFRYSGLTSLACLRTWTPCQ